LFAHHLKQTSISGRQGNKQVNSIYGHEQHLAAFHLCAIVNASAEIASHWSQQLLMTPGLRPAYSVTLDNIEVPTYAAV
jgi:hypothetical protein